MTYQTDPAKQEKIDAILRQIAALESNSGKDSTPHERLVCKSKQGVLLNQIKAIDVDFYKVLVPVSFNPF